MLKRNALTLVVAGALLFASNALAEPNNNPHQPPTGTKAQCDAQAKCRSDCMNGQTSAESAVSCEKKYCGASLYCPTAARAPMGGPTLHNPTASEHPLPYSPKPDTSPYKPK